MGNKENIELEIRINPEGMLILEMTDKQNNRALGIRIIPEVACRLGLDIIKTAMRAHILFEKKPSHITKNCQFCGSPTENTGGPIILCAQCTKRAKANLN